MEAGILGACTINKGHFGARSILEGAMRTLFLAAIAAIFLSGCVGYVPVYGGVSYHGARYSGSIRTYAPAPAFDCWCAPSYGGRLFPVYPYSY